ncbi:unnamed protein product [marine sediment metagenome]|uniref:Uncharacterized protein n=1 Tax=marine sediment metagenome TaxID=412755 RepID=X1BHU7_9ZZZZ
MRSNLINPESNVGTKEKAKFLFGIYYEVRSIKKNALPFSDAALEFIANLSSYPFKSIPRPASMVSEKILAGMGYLRDGNNHLTDVIRLIDDAIGGEDFSEREKPN